MYKALSLIGAPILLLLCVCSLHSPAYANLERRWPYNLPADAKYWPEDGPKFRRDIQNLHGPHDYERHVVIRALPLDEEAKYYPYIDDILYSYNDSARFSGERQEQEIGNESVGEMSKLRPRAAEDDEWESYGNSSAPYTFKPPFNRHTNHDFSLVRRSNAYESFISRMIGRSEEMSITGLMKRDNFSCPVGSTDCGAIGRPNSCCSLDEDCHVIQDTGLGDVGCCPKMKACSGDLTSCNLGFTLCSDNLGGGCCIPLYVCVDVGCAPGPQLSVITTVYPTSGKLSNPPVPTSSAAGSFASTTTISTTATPPSSTPCASAYQECPSTLGGGCCRTDQECGATDCPSPGSSFGAPFRGTATQTAKVTPQATSTTTGTACPSDYYLCDAYNYNGGCCRIGRDCGKTNCPATSSTTVVNGNSITIAIPETLTLVTPNPTYNNPNPCVPGYTKCPWDACCPSRLSCGQRLITGGNAVENLCSGLTTTSTLTDSVTVTASTAAGSMTGTNSDVAGSSTGAGVNTIKVRAAASALWHDWLAIAGVMGIWILAATL